MAGPEPRRRPRSTRAATRRPTETRHDDPPRSEHAPLRAVPVPPVPRTRSGSTRPSTSCPRGAFARPKARSRRRSSAATGSDRTRSDAKGISRGNGPPIACPRIPPATSCRCFSWSSARNRAVRGRTNRVPVGATPPTRRAEPARLAKARLGDPFPAPRPELASTIGSSCTPRSEGGAMKVIPAAVISLTFLLAAPVRPDESLYRLQARRAHRQGRRVAGLDRRAGAVADQDHDGSAVSVRDQSGRIRHGDRHRKSARRRRYVHARVGGGECALFDADADDNRCGRLHDPREHCGAELPGIRQGDAASLARVDGASSRISACGTSLRPSKPKSSPDDQARRQ